MSTETFGCIEMTYIGCFCQWASCPYSNTVISAQCLAGDHKSSQRGAGSSTGVSLALVQLLEQGQAHSRYSVRTHLELPSSCCQNKQALPGDANLRGMARVPSCFDEGITNTTAWCAVSLTVNSQKMQPLFSRWKIVSSPELICVEF